MRLSWILILWTRPDGKKITVTTDGEAAHDSAQWSRYGFYRGRQRAEALQCVPSLYSDTDKARY